MKLFVPESNSQYSQSQEAYFQRKLLGTQQKLGSPKRIQMRPMSLDNRLYIPTPSPNNTTKQCYQSIIQDWFSLTKRKSFLKHQKTKEFEDIERKIKHIKQKLNSGQFDIRVGGQKISLGRKPGDESDKNILVKALMTKTPVPLRSPQFAQFKDSNLRDFYSKETNFTLMKPSNPCSTNRAIRTHTNVKYTKVLSPTEEFNERMQSIELSSSGNQINLITEVKDQAQNQQMCGWLNSNNQIGEMYEYQIDDYMVQN